MELKFAKEQSREMYDILVEIHSALSDKSMNKGGILKLSQYEIGWLLGIDEFLTKIGKHDNSNVESMTKYSQAQ